MNTKIETLKEHGMQLRYAASSRGGEYAGPCIYCEATKGQGGNDRLRVRPFENRFWCRQCHTSGALPELLGVLSGLSLVDAVAAIGPSAPVPRQREHLESSTKMPSRRWMERAQLLVDECAAAIGRPENRDMLDHLHARMLRDDTIVAFRLGAVATTRYENRADWGLPDEANPETGRAKVVCLPRGILIPTLDHGAVVALQVRVFDAKFDSRYLNVPGSSSQPYVIPARCAA